MEITPGRLATMLRPRSVALVGAAEKSGFSRTAYGNLVAVGRGEAVHLVNRRGAVTHGRPTVTSCQQIGEPADLAFLMVPQAGTLDALADAAAAGIRNAIVLSAGYAETGPAGRAAQDELVARARELGMLLLGPNMLGFANFIDQIPVTAVPGLPRDSGPVALLSQSGASSSAMVEFAATTGVGLSYLVTLGNEAMITAGHVLDYLVDDEATRAIAIFMETIRDPDTFRRAARRAAEAGKAVVVLKVGRGQLSARTAAAHTGALVGDDATVSAVLRDLGVIRVDSIEDMLITAGAAAHLGRLRRPGIGVVSVSGGACDIVADQAEDLGAELPELASGTREALARLMPGYGTVQNPLDVTGAAVIDPSLFTRAIETMSADPSVGVVAVINALPWRPAPGSGPGPWHLQPIASAIGAGIAAARVPVVYVSQVLQPITGYTRQVLDEAGVPYAIPGLGQAVAALARVAWWSRASGVTSEPVPPPRLVQSRADAAARRGAWSEAATRELLTAAGVPVVPARLVTSAAEAQTAATEFGVPLAVKVSSPDIVHKTAAGGVRLNVPPGRVRVAYDEVTEAAAGRGARTDGVLIAPMRGPGTELLVGVARDPDWGLMLAVAVGGVFVEILNDSALATLPISPARARDLLQSLRAARLLAPMLETIVPVVVRVGDLAVSLGDDLESLEINPLLIGPRGAEALDAVVTWSALDAELA
jgi:acetate---CoA ligase (ADP-forming)